MSNVRRLLAAVALLFFDWASLGAGCNGWPDYNPSDCTPDPEAPSLCEQTECPLGYVYVANGGGGGAGGDVGAGGDDGAGGDSTVAASSTASAGAGGAPGAGSGAGAGDTTTVGAGGGSHRAVPRPQHRRPHYDGEHIGMAVSAQCVPQQPADAYIFCRQQGLSPQACSFACGQVGAACGSVAAHPNKLGQGTGQLTYCKNGGPTYTCTYTFPNGEGCTGIFTPIGITWKCYPPTN